MLLFLGAVSDVGDQVVQDSQHPIGSLAQNHEDAKTSSRKIIIPPADDDLASRFILNLVLCGRRDFSWGFKSRLVKKSYAVVVPGNRMLPDAGSIKYTETKPCTLK